MQVTLQRRSANRLSGWIGYTLAYSRETFIFPKGLLVVPTLTDQRHTVNAFAMYRLTPSINLSGKVIYGSGIPISSLGFQIVNGNLVPVGPSHALFGPHERLDLRIDKAWAFSRWKMTLYAEGLNLTNHDNPRLITFGVNFTNGNLTPITERGLPVTPTAGLSFEF
jgi:hypothetical protein